VRQTRIVNLVRPAETANHDGLAYSLWLPHATPPRGGILILHGAGSCRESHYDYARAALPLGLAALAFDQRGHGTSDGALDGRAVQDVATMAALLRRAIGGQEPPIALRGSSMGGYLAIVAAHAAQADAVVAICPASAQGLRRALSADRFAFAADAPALDRLLAEHDVQASISELEIPVLLLHAEGDEVVPVEHSRALAKRLRHPDSRLIAVPGGHHRSIQHDAELQGVSLRFVAGALSRARVE
jgi:alpha-beta hydrolase superfamily lysophospholipase